ncbi:MAG: DUF4321 domain-containing protein [Candidatus Edwardsbacteria bacterium]
MRKRSVGFFLLVILLGGLIGSAVGELIGYVLPSGVVKDFFTRSVTPHFAPVTLNLLVCTITFGFAAKLNVVSLLGMVLVFYLLRWF